MQALDRLALKIRRRETPTYDLLYRVIKGALNLHFPFPDAPAVRAAARALYLGHSVSLTVAVQLKSILWAEPLFRSKCVRVGKNFKVEVLPWVEGHARIFIGDDVTFGGPVGIFSGRFHDAPELIIGDHVYIGPECRITVNQRVELKEHASVSSDVVIADSDGHPLDWQRRAAKAPLAADEIKPVVIGAHAWIGRGSHIMKGVTIGDHSIVGSNSLVISDVPPDSLAIGSPARVLRLPGAPAPQK